MDNNDENNFDEPIDENEEKRVKKDIEVITGDGDNLEISPVYSHIKIDKPYVNRNRNKQIIIPKKKIMMIVMIVKMKKILKRLKKTNLIMFYILKKANIK